MPSRSRARLALACTVALAVVLQGCVLFDPSVRPLRLEDKKAKTQTDAQALQEVIDACTQIRTGDVKAASVPAVCDSFAYVEGYRLAYLDAAGIHSKLRNSVAWGALPLSGLALYYGLTGKAPSNGERIARFGIASGVGYSLATFSTSVPRQQIYLDGAQAMSCLMGNAAPLIIPDQAEGRLKSATNRLDDEVIDLQKTIAEELAAGNLSEADVAAGRQTAADGRNAVAHARQTIATLARAAVLLRVRADHIAQLVDKQAIAQEASLQSLLALSKNLASTSRDFGQGFVPPAPQSAAPGAPKAFAGNPAQQRVDKHIGAVRASIADVNGLLQEFADLSGALESIDSCGIGEHPIEFSVDPDLAELTVEVGATKSFTVVNRNSLPTRELVGGSVASVTVEDTRISSDGTKFVITVKGVTANGADGPSLVIRDGTGTRSHKTKITVTAKAAAAPAPTPSTPPAVPKAVRILTDVEAQMALHPDDVRVLQCGIGLPHAEIDCKLGPKTFKAVAQFRIDEKISDSGLADEVTERLFDAASKRAANQCEDVKCPAP